MCSDWEVFESKGVRIKKYHCIYQNSREKITKCPTTVSQPSFLPSFHSIVNLPVCHPTLLKKSNRAAYYCITTFLPFYHLPPHCQPVNPPPNFTQENNKATYHLITTLPLSSLFIITSNSAPKLTRVVSVLFFYMYIICY